MYNDRTFENEWPLAGHGVESLMCGIVGYVGEENAVPYLINGLRKLEYRGYDSSGIVVGKMVNNKPVFELYKNLFRGKLKDDL